VASLGSISVEFDGQTHTMELKKIDLVRVEQALQTSVGKLEGVTALYAYAWAAARRNKIEGVPDTFDAFLELDPECDEVDEATGDEGKGSGKGQSTG
jgi:hypothetical protein